MKRILFITLLYFTSIIYAQEETFCYTSSASPYLQDLETIRGLDHSNDIFYIKIYIHVLRREIVPKLGQTREDVNIYLKQLYSDFDPLGIHFVWDDYIDYIDNDEFFYSPMESSEPSSAPSIFNTNNHSDGIDIYFCDINARGILGQLGTAFGRAENIGSSAFIIGGWARAHHPTNGDELIPLSLLKTISHEMGHVLFLFHTFHGTTDRESENAGDPYACKELVNPITDPNHEDYDEQHDNKHKCGDYVYDTAANPEITWFSPTITEVDENCEYNNNPNDYIPDFDENGDPYDPDPTNLMCYTYPTCYEDFTFGQKKRMKNAIWYLPVLNSTLITDYTYIRPVVNCFICDEQFFNVYSTEDLNHLYPISTENLITEITQQTSEYLTIKVTNNYPDLDEGERGDFSIVSSGKGMVVAKQSVWVGLPQIVPDETVNGPTLVNPGQRVTHKMGDGFLRLEGIKTYEWVFPEPNISYVAFPGPQPNDSSIWEYTYLSNYIPRVDSSVGDKTDHLTVQGKNPCGLGDFGDSNELCVENTGDDQLGCLPPIIYYPNPADDLLEIDLSLQDYDIFTVTVYDNNQIVVYTDQSENVVKTIDTFNLSNDTYYLHIYNGIGELILSRTLIINHY